MRVLSNITKTELNYLTTQPTAKKMIQKVKTEGTYIAKGNAKGNIAQNSENTSLRKLEYEHRQNESKSIIDQSLLQAQQLRTQRTKDKKTDLQKKRLQYSFKKVSSQIIRSKTSMQARTAVSMAKHEINRLKRLKKNENYDEEEIQIALDHAKSMEKIAKKKVNHLQQEEMIERGNGSFSVNFEEKENKETNEGSELENEILEEELTEDELIDEEFESDFEEIDFNQEFSKLSDINMENLEDLNSLFSEELEDMLENLDLEDFLDSVSSVDINMSKDDLKMLKIKHRFKELKEIAQADKQYLKEMIKYEEEKGTNISFSGSMPNFNGFEQASMNVTIPETGISFDVCV